MSQLALSASFEYLLGMGRRRSEDFLMTGLIWSDDDIKVNMSGLVRQEVEHL